MQPSPRAIDQVRSWARLALRAEGGAHVDPAPAGCEVDDLLAAVGRHRLAALLAAHAEALGLPPALADPLRNAVKGENRAIMLQLLELSRIAALFETGGIPWLTFKGPALAVQSAGNVSARGAGDLDIFVAADAVADVMRCLTGNGWSVRTTSPPDPGSWAWRFVLRTYNELTLDGPGSTVDVHWRLDPSRGLPDFETAWRRRAAADLGELTVQTLCVGDAFAQSCSHAAKDDWRWLRSLVDIHRLARSPEVFVAPLRPLEAAALAVTQASIGLPEGVPAAVLAQTHRSSRPVRRALASQAGPPNLDSGIPGAHTLRGIRYRVRAGGNAADVLIALAAAVLPADVVASSRGGSAWRAVPGLLVRRVGSWLARLGRRVSAHAPSSQAQP